MLKKTITPQAQGNKAVKQVWIWKAATYQLSFHL